MSKGFPCGHALTILLGQTKVIKDYVKPYFTVDSFARSYAGAIVHPHTIDFAAPLEFDPPRPRSHSRSHSTAFSDDDDDGSDSDATVVLPPSTRRPPGRPKKRRIRSRVEIMESGPVKRQKCGRCKAVGHKRRTCREVI